MSERERVVFLDIDGVLLTPRAWAMPGNAPVMQMRKACRRGGEHQWPWMDLVQFDPCAVGLVNRLCEIAGARLVVSSNWRITYRGPAETVEKLVSQGIKRELFHTESWVTNVHGIDRKQWSIKTWLEHHKGDLSEFLSIDDEEFDHKGFSMPNLVHCNAYEGMSFANYVHAVRCLDSDDEACGVYRIPEEIREVAYKYRWPHYRLVQFIDDNGKTYKDAYGIVRAIERLGIIEQKRRRLLRFRIERMRFRKPGKRWKTWPRVTL